MEVIEPIFVLNFHGIGKPSRRLEEDEEQFWISEAHFHEVISLVMRMRERRSVEITFDDGNSSDFSVGYARLMQENITGSFFVLAGRIGALGHLTADQLRKMAASRMNIGLHGMDHVDWTRPDDAGLKREILDARTLIEAATGEKVTSAAVPFGRYNRRILKILRASGFSRIYTTDRGILLSNGIVRSRLSMRCDMSVDELERTIENAFGFGSRIVTEIKFRLKDN